MFKKDIIGSSESPWGAPVILAVKKDSGTHLLMDYRKLNEVTHRDAYPLPDIQMCLYALTAARFFCSLYFTSSYWQIRVCEQDHEKISFVPHKGLFQFKVIPFRLVHTPASFVHLMEVMLRGLQWKHYFAIPG